VGASNYQLVTNLLNTIKQIIMKKFFQKIDFRSKKQMIDFLEKHFRYHTMNSWNNSTSYAHNMKFNRLFSGNILDKVFELSECEDFYDQINDLCNDFDINHDYNFRIGFNGRSGGYLVMAKGTGQRNVFCSGSLDQDEDFNEWSIEALKDRVKLVQEFDQLADDILECVLEMVKTACVKVEKYTVTKTRKVLC
jgi:hypothetical protein